MDVDVGRMAGLTIRQIGLDFSLMRIGKVEGNALTRSIAALDGCEIEG
jgi:hypothetical protein